jgi:ERCC4-type nuclease
MEVKCVLDNRELALKNMAALMQHVDTCENMDLGDFSLSINGQVHVLVERKTLSDLASSVKDGRYKEQKSRQLSVFGKEKLIYVIEGRFNFDDSSGFITGLPKKTITSCIINSFIRDGIRIMMTANPMETANFLIALCIRVRKDPSKYLQKETDIVSNYNECLKAKKIDNLTPRTVFVAQLCQIPKISTKTAYAIADRFTNMRDICANGNAEIISMLKLDSGKFIGNRLSAGVCEYLGIICNQIETD